MRNSASLRFEAAQPFRPTPTSETTPAPPRLQDIIRATIGSGILAGAVGTAAMTLIMETFYHLLPQPERQPLEPSQILRQITRIVAPPAQIRAPIDESLHIPMTLAAHLGYGMFGGIAYTTTMRHIALPPSVRGALFGVGLFAFSYLGWLPSVGILKPATTYSRGRLLGLITSHIVYGSVTASTADRLQRLTPQT